VEIGASFPHQTGELAVSSFNFCAGNGRAWGSLPPTSTSFFLEDSLGRPPISESGLGYVKRKKLKSHKNDIFVHLTVICAKLYSVAHNASPRSKPHSGHTPDAGQNTARPSEVKDRP